MVLLLMTESHVEALIIPAFLYNTFFLGLIIVLLSDETHCIFALYEKVESYQMKWSVGGKLLKILMFFIVLQNSQFADSISVQNKMTVKFLFVIICFIYLFSTYIIV